MIPRLLTALLLFVFVTHLQAEDRLVIAAPIGLLSEELIDDLEERTDIAIDHRTYSRTADVLVSLSLTKEMYDLVLIDRSYLPGLQEMELLRESGHPRAYDTSSNLLEKVCPSYAYGESVLLTDAKIDSDGASWRSILSGQYGASNSIYFSSLTESGYNLIKVLGNKDCKTDTCVIESVVTSLRIMNVAYTNNPNSINEYSILPEYLARQKQALKPQLSYSSIIGNNKVWVKHWCVIDNENSDTSLRLLQEIYDPDLIDLNASITKARLVTDPNIVDNKYLDNILTYPGNELFDLYSIIVGVGEALYER